MSGRKWNADLTAEELRQLLVYDPDDGSFVWRSRTANAVKIGARAGTANRSGRRVIQIRGKLYKASRLAWLYMTGEWPTDLVDHVNRDPGDDRWCNLRDATYRLNNLNRQIESGASGVAGVSQHGRSWRAYVSGSAGRVNIGTFQTIEKAQSARAAFIKTGATCDG